jgi:hypothetical protein
MKEKLNNEKERGSSQAVGASRREEGVVKKW